MKNWYYIALAVRSMRCALIMALLLFASCDGPYYDKDPDTVKIKTDTNIVAFDGSAYTIGQYKGCYYFISTRDNSITHLGNCPNPIHKLYYCDTLIVHDTIFVGNKAM